MYLDISYVHLNI